MLLGTRQLQIRSLSAFFFSLSNICLQWRPLCLFALGWLFPTQQTLSTRFSSWWFWQIHQHRMVRYSNGHSYGCTLSLHYLIQFDDGNNTKSVPVADMSSMIPKPLTDVSAYTHLIPPFLRLNFKIPFEHNGQYRKDYLTQSPDGVYCFSCKLHVNKKQEDWGVPLPHLPMTWHDLCT